MHRKIALLRTVVLALLVGFVLLVALLYNSQARGKRTDAQSVQPAERANDRAQLVADVFEDTQTIGGRVVSKIRAKKTTQFKSGWFLLEEVQLTLYRPDGRTYELFCPSAEFNLQTKEADVKGGVRITSSDGIELTTQEMKFDGNQLLNRIPVQFKVEGWSGRAGGLELNLQNETLRLLGNLAVSRPAVSGDPAMSLSADEAVLFRTSGEIIFSPNVELHRGPDVLRAKTVSAKSEGDGQKLTALAGNENVGIHVSGQTASAAGGAVEISADGFFGDFDPNGVLRQFLIVSKEKAHAVMGGADRREIDARQFRLVFAGGTPSELHAEGSVVMRETGQVHRTVTADNSVVFFDSATRKATNGVADGNVVYDDGRSHAAANRANFDIGGDRMYLTALAGQQPAITSDGNVIKANVIEILPGAKILKANGGVGAQLMPKKGASASGTAVFPVGATPVFVNSAALVIQQQSQTATFSGNVRAWQEKNTILASEIQVLGSGDVVQAKGGVRAIFYNANDKTKETPLYANSDVLTARKTEQKVVLEGHVKIDDESRSLTAQSTVLMLGADKKIERIEATGAVQVTDKATQRSGSGDKATYNLPQQMLHLNGSPAVLKDARGTVKGQLIVFDLAKNKVDVTGSVPSETTYNPPS